MEMKSHGGPVSDSVPDITNVCFFYMGVC